MQCQIKKMILPQYLRYAIMHFVKIDVLITPAEADFFMKKIWPNTRFIQAKA